MKLLALFLIGLVLGFAWTPLALILCAPAVLSWAAIALTLFNSKGVRLWP